MLVGGGGTGGGLEGGVPLRVNLPIGGGIIFPSFLRFYVLSESEKRTFCGVEWEWVIVVVLTPKMVIGVEEMVIISILIPTVVNSVIKNSETRKKKKGQKERA